ncbi:uncharacterized protein B0T15DRAFT_543119 [Chaetomium strumarium]|uniref:Secreted protein n=1 Tax=Chaetomium strumarium TaxID=1170767 RepID=A0AAJ0LYL1_9PEZI|nr:hypothetical protein B0T15DRAFT_543119 [Chaetomium strumarium]
MNLFGALPRISCVLWLCPLAHENFEQTAPGKLLSCCDAHMELERSHNSCGSAHATVMTHTSQHQRLQVSQTLIQQPVVPKTLFQTYNTPLGRTPFTGRPAQTSFFPCLVRHWARPPPA